MDKVREALEAISWTCVLGHKVVDLDEVLNILKDVDNWQPISTAPKNGSEFLACLSNGWRVILSAGIAIREGHRYAWWISSCLSSIPYVPSHPKDTNWEASYTIIATHWQPLPNPPDKG